MNKLWLIEPSAAPNDPRWQDRPIWQRLVVRAETEGMARMLAEKYVLERTARAGHPGNESPSPVGGPKDAKLYAVQEITEERLKRILPTGHDGGTNKGIIFAEPTSL